MGTTPNTTKRIDALDGLRALAIVAVVLFHMRPTLLKGGFIGVTMFFVLTGFLITSGFERQYAKRRTFSYGAFLKKRVLRLLPPILVVVALTALATWLASPSLLPKVQSDAAASAGFFLNWSYITREVSYFNAAGLPSPLTHLWYVALIMQFYVAWPLVLLGSHAFCHSRRRMLQVILALAIASTLLMVIRFDPAADTSRVYYGTDTRLAELLIGSAAAIGLDWYRLLRAKARKRRTPAPVSLATIRALGAAGLVLLAVASVFASGSSPLLYRGGYLVLSVLCAFVVVAVQTPGSLTARILGSKPFVTVGLRSFSIYLTHYPVLILMNPATRTTELAWWEVALQLVVVAAVAEAFYRLIEKPCQTLGSARHASPRKTVASPWFIASAYGVLTLALLCFLPLDWDAVAQRRSEFLRPELVEQQAKIDEVIATTPIITEAEAEAQESATKPIPNAEIVPSNLDTAGWTYDEATGTTDANVLIIGDSVTEGSTEQIEAVFTDAVIDAVIGRQLYVGGEIYQEHVAAGDDSRAVVMALGGNDTLRDIKFVRELVESVEGKPVYLVTIRCPYDFQKNNNDLLRQVAEEYDNVGLIDWYGYSAGHDDWFWNDGQHLTPTGSAAYAELLKQAFVG